MYLKEVLYSSVVYNYREGLLPSFMNGKEDKVLLRFCLLKDFTFCAPEKWIIFIGHAYVLNQLY